MDNTPAVTVHRSSFVLPAAPTRKGRLYLSCLDLMWRDLQYMRSLFFFKSEMGEYLPIVENLKKSLALALVEFYPFAGRLARDECGRLEVDCNDAGVEFVEASVDVSFGDLEENLFQINPFFTNLTRMGEIERSDDLELPLLSVQVTRFLDGEIVIGTAENHVIADGYSFWHFLNSWTECARGLPISLLPVHLRTALRPTEPPSPSTDQNGEEINFKNCLTQNQDRISSRSTTYGPTELAQRVFLLSGEMIKKLKMKTTEDGKPPCTSFEVLCAHLWKQVMLARELEESQRVAIDVYMDVRFRLDPPLPTGYFGNATIGEQVLATAEELEKESLRSTALRIHETIVSFQDAYYVRHLLRVFDEADFNVVDFQKFEESKKKDIVRAIVSFSHKFPVYEIDFGFGRPSCVRSPLVVNGEMVLYGRGGGGDVDVCIGLPPKVMSKLQANPHFVIINT